MIFYVAASIFSRQSMKYVSYFLYSIQHSVTTFCNSTQAEKSITSKLFLPNFNLFWYPTDLFHLLLNNWPPRFAPTPSPAFVHPFSPTSSFTVVPDSYLLIPSSRRLPILGHHSPSANLTLAKTCKNRPFFRTLASTYIGSYLSWFRASLVWQSLQNFSRQRS